MKTRYDVNSLSIAVALISVIGLSGCGTALELQQATNALGDTVPRLVNAQIFHNYDIKKHHPYRMPAELVIGTGSTQVSNQLILPSTTVNLTDTIFRTFGLQNQNQWQQGWSVSAVIDPGDLMRLDALYRYAAGETTMCDFIRSYDRAYIATTASTSLRLSDFDDFQARRDDYQKPELPAQPAKVHSDNEPAPDPAFNHNGPPATLPFPPRSAATRCGSTGQLDAASLEPEHWPFPFPASQDFIRKGLKVDQTWELAGQHELADYFIKPEQFAMFQYWILGATVNTAKSNSSSPAKGISGAAG